MEKASCTSQARFSLHCWFQETHRSWSLGPSPKLMGQRKVNGLPVLLTHVNPSGSSTQTAWTCLNLFKYKGSIIIYKIEHYYQCVWLSSTSKLNLFQVGICCVTQGAQPSSLWQPGVRGGGGDGKAVGGTGHMYTVADSCWYMAEINTML